MTYNAHWKQLHNYVNDLVPKLNENLVNSLRNKAATKTYDWMTDVCRFVPKIGQYKSSWVNRGSIEPIRQRREAQGLPQIQMPDVTRTELVTSLWGDGFPITEEYMFYADKKLELTPDLEAYTEDFAEGILKRQSMLISDVLLDAFDGSIYTYSDGKALCAEAHTFLHGDSNLTNVFHTPFSVEGLREMRGTRLFTDDQGMPLLMNYDTLLVGVGLEDQAQEIMRTQSVPYSQENTINVDNDRYRIVVVPWLDDTFKAGASEWYFLMDSNQHTIEMHITRNPIIQFREVINGRDMGVERLADFNIGWENPRAIVGSDGAGS